MRRRLRVSSAPLEEIQRAAETIYIYGYPLLLMDIMRRSHIAPTHRGAHGAPTNRFGHERFLPVLAGKRANHANVDCLSSSAWLDLGKEPIVLSIPRSDRYFLLSLFSGWYEIFGALSSRTVGKKAGHFAFVGPNWCGKLPAGVKCCSVPTDFVFIDGYLAVAGPEDVQVAHSTQDQFVLTPLSRWSGAQPHGTPFGLTTEHKVTPAEQLDSLDVDRFYTQLARLLTSNGPQSSDSEILAECARIGFFPAADFDFQMLPADTIDAMQSAAPAARFRIAEAEVTPNVLRLSNNWLLHTHPGRYHKDYLIRAAAARSGGTAVLGEDITCLHASVDSYGEPLRGAHAYVMTFHLDQIPPVNAFWSITVYDRLQRIFPHSTHRYAIGDRDRLRLNADSSLSIFLQHEWPGAALDSNWIPVPKDSFNLALRIYSPKADFSIGKWRPPAVTKMI